MALTWDYDDEGGWEAASNMGGRDEWGYGYNIDVTEDGRFSVTASTEIDHDNGPPEPLLSLAEAKAWCERREAELLATATT